MQMANLLIKPKLLIPLMINAGIMGVLGAIFNIQGNSMSAGFGFSGLIGPVAAMANRPTNFSNIALMTILFFILPIILGLIANYILSNKLNFFSSKDFELDFN